MEKFEIVTWPESQLLMDREGFRTHCRLINSERGIKKYGSSAYLVDPEWYRKFEQNDLGPETKEHELVIETDDSVIFPEDESEKDSDSGYVIVTWPESQTLNLYSGFYDNCQLINSDYGIEVYGPEAYLVNRGWYKRFKREQLEEITKEEILENEDTDICIYDNSIIFTN